MYFGSLWRPEKSLCYFDNVNLLNFSRCKLLLLSIVAAIKELTRTFFSTFNLCYSSNVAALHEANYSNFP
jgi:hypothetical protein